MSKLTIDRAAVRRLVHRQFVATGMALVALLVLGGCTYRSRTKLSMTEGLRRSHETELGLPAVPLMVHAPVVAAAADRGRLKGFGIAPEALGRFE